MPSLGVTIHQLAHSTLPNTPPQMRQITLSDHANDQATAAAQRRQSDFQVAQVHYRTLLDQRKLRATELVQATRTAWAERKYLAWFASFFPRLGHALSSGPAAPTKAEAQREEIVFNAGAEGERKVVQALAAQLTDKWVAISGYKNPSGEIDIVVVGPPGVMAIEVKFVNGKVFCDGDRWWRDKYDKYGNLVESGLTIADRGGRGPSVQVNASADRLQRFLAERTPVKRVLRTVVLAHESSSLGQLSSITVDSIALVSELRIEAIFDQKMTTREQYLVDDLVRLIGQDHQFHESRRPSTARGSGRDYSQASGRR